MLLYFRNLLNTSIRRVHGAPLATLDPSHDVRNLLLCLNASNIRKHHKTMTVTSTPSTQQNMKLSLILKVSSLPSPTLNISIAPLAPWAGGCCASTCEDPNPRPKLDDCRPLEKFTSLSLHDVSRWNLNDCCLHQPNRLEFIKKLDLSLIYHGIPKTCNFERTGKTNKPLQIPGPIIQQSRWPWCTPPHPSVLKSWPGLVNGGA